MIRSTPDDGGREPEDPPGWFSAVGDAEEDGGGGEGEDAGSGVLPD